MGGFSEISIIVPPPHIVSGRLWANGVFGGILSHFNGLEKREILRSESVHLTFDPIASGFDPSKDTVIDATNPDPQVTTGELT